MKFQDFFVTLHMLASSKDITGGKNMDKYDVQSITIKAPFKKVFDFVVSAQNLPKWTNAFKNAENGAALMVTPNGEISIKLEVKSDPGCGNIDWYMTFPDDTEGRAYSRVVSLDQDQVLYSFILLAPPVPLEQLEGALEEQKLILAEELKRLKKILESR